MGCVSLVFGVVSLLSLVVSVSGIGANWGTQSTHPLPPETVVRLLRDNGFQKVKLFDADSGALKALGKSGIEVMVGIPNDMLATIAGSMKAAEKWVSKNISSPISNYGVNIRLFLSISCWRLGLNGNHHHHHPQAIPIIWGRLHESSFTIPADPNPG